MFFPAWTVTLASALNRPGSGPPNNGDEQSCGLAFCASSSVPSPSDANAFRSHERFARRTQCARFGPSPRPCRRARRRSHVGASEIAIEMSTRIWCARPSRSRPSGTLMSLGPEGSLLTLSGRTIRNRVASRFVVVPISTAGHQAGLPNRTDHGAPTMQDRVPTLHRGHAPARSTRRPRIRIQRDRLQEASATTRGAPSNDYRRRSARRIGSGRLSTRRAQRREATGFRRYDVLWLGLIASLAGMLWYLVLR